MEMERVLKDKGGLALAAPQLGIPYKIIVIKVPKTAPNTRYDFEQDPNHVEFPLTYIINPEFKPINNETSVGWESCLSLPGYRGKVERFSSIKCYWSNTLGHKEYMRLDGFNARVFQHEYDHLQGITYIEKLHNIKTFTYIGAGNE